MHIKKVIFLIICIFVLSFALTGCYDLGDGAEDDAEYCSFYPEVRVIDGRASIHYYTMDDFYNKEAVNDFKSPMEEDERSEYSYILIKVDEDLSVGNIAIHIDSIEEETVQASFFVLDEVDIPTKVYTGLSGRYSVFEMDEPSDDLVVGRTTVRMPGGVENWRAIFLQSWGEGETRTKRYDVKSGQYIVVRIDNNRYEPLKMTLDTLAELWQSAKDRYQQALQKWNSLNDDGSASQEEKNAAMSELTAAGEELNVTERDYGEAQDKYEKEKFPYGKVSIRVTAILINAE